MRARVVHNVGSNQAPDRAQQAQGVTQALAASEAITPGQLLRKEVARRKQAGIRDRHLLWGN